MFQAHKDPTGNTLWLDLKLHKVSAAFARTFT